MYLPDSPVWFIAHNGSNVFHVGNVASCNEMVTTQPIMETFELEQLFVDRCADLGIDAETGEKL